MFKSTLRFFIVALFALVCTNCAEDDTGDGASQIAATPEFIDQPAAMVFDDYAVSTSVTTFTIKNYDAKKHTVRTSSDEYACEYISTEGDISTFAVTRVGASAAADLAVAIEIVWGENCVKSCEFTVTAPKGGVISRPATINTFLANMKKGQTAQTAFNFSIDGAQPKVTDIEIVATEELAAEYIVPSVALDVADPAVTNRYIVTFTALKNSDLTAAVDNTYQVRIKGLKSAEFPVTVQKITKITGFKIEKEEEDDGTGTGTLTPTAACLVDYSAEVGCIFPQDYPSTNVLTIKTLVDNTYDDNADNIIYLAAIKSLAADDLSKCFDVAIGLDPYDFTATVKVKDGKGAAAASEQFEYVLSNGSKGVLTLSICGDITFAAMPMAVTMPYNMVVDDVATTTFKVEGTLLETLDAGDVQWVSSKLNGLPDDYVQDPADTNDYTTKAVWDEYIELASITEDPSMPNLYTLTFKGKKEFEGDYALLGTYQINAEGTLSSTFTVRIDPKTKITKVTVNGRAASETANYSFPNNYASKAAIAVKVVLNSENIASNTVGIKEVVSSNPNASTYYVHTYTDGVTTDTPLQFKLTMQGQTLPDDFEDIVTVTLTNGNEYKFKLNVAKPITIKTQPAAITYPYNTLAAASLTTTFKVDGVVLANNTNTKVVFANADSYQTFDVASQVSASVSGTTEISVTFKTTLQAPAERLEGTYYVEISGAKTEPQKIVFEPAVYIWKLQFDDAAPVNTTMIAAGASKIEKQTQTEYTHDISSTDPFKVTFTLPKERLQTNSTVLNGVSFTDKSGSYEYKSLDAEYRINADNSISFDVKIQPKMSVATGDALVCTVNLLSNKSVKKKCVLTVKYTAPTPLP